MWSRNSPSHQHFCCSFAANKYIDCSSSRLPMHSSQLPNKSGVMRFCLLMYFTVIHFHYFFLIFTMIGWEQNHSSGNENQFAHFHPILDRILSISRDLYLCMWNSVLLNLLTVGEGNFIYSPTALQYQFELACSYSREVEWATRTNRRLMLHVLTGYGCKFHSWLKRTNMHACFWLTSLKRQQSYRMRFYFVLEALPCYILWVWNFLGNRTNNQVCLSI